MVGKMVDLEERVASAKALGAIPFWQSAGYRTKLIFLRLASVELAIERVAARVRQGGHDIPEAVIRRRYEAGWRNFRELYRNRVDSWQVYGNSGVEPVLLEEKV